MNQISLKYFTGTGNSLRVIEICENIFKQNDFSVNTSSITDKNKINNDCDIIGFCFPVVPRGKARIRVQLSAAHSSEQIDKAVEAFIKVGKELEII